MKKLITYIMHHRAVVLVVIALITLFFGYQMKNLKINSDIIKSLPEDDPAASMYKKIGEKYKGSTIGIIIFNSENLYSAKSIEDIARITETVKKIEGVEFCDQRGFRWQVTFEKDAEVTARIRAWNAKNDMFLDEKISNNR